MCRQVGDAQALPEVPSPCPPRAGAAPGQDTLPACSAPSPPAPLQHQPAPGEDWGLQTRQPRLGNTCHGAPCHLNWGQGGTSWGGSAHSAGPHCRLSGMCPGAGASPRMQTCSPLLRPFPTPPCTPRLPSPGKEKNRSCAYELFGVSLCLFCH